MLCHTKDRHARATAALQEAECGPTAVDVVDRLSANFNVLRDQLLKRVHDDVESRFWLDSTIAPMTESAEEREIHRAQVEIELFMIVTAANELAEANYVEQDEKWCRQWLADLRLGENVADGIESRFASYMKRDLEHRRLLFSDLFARWLPDASAAHVVSV